jgi:hypothetical protein
VAAYEPLTVDAGGRGTGQATARMPLPTEGPFLHSRRGLTGVAGGNRRVR